MSSPCRDITVLCPSCGKPFESWFRDSLNLQMDHFDDEYIRSVNVKTCPHCKAEVHLSSLIVGEDGVWRFADGRQTKGKSGQHGGGRVHEAEHAQQAKKRAALDRFLADNPELEQLNARLATFNIFRALRIEGIEIRHSNTLGWLLDPAESHGLDEVFLRRLLSNMLLASQVEINDISPADVELMTLGDVEVRREWRNVDLLVVIRSQPNVVLLIENKIGAGEGRGQLTRYRGLVEQEFPSFVLVPVFLTLEGEASADEEALGYINYSHAQVLDVLARIVEQRRSQLPEAVAVFMNHYLETLRRLTMKDQSLVDLCKTIYRKHKEAIDQIVEYGVASEFEQVGSEVLAKEGEFEILYATPKQLWFIPTTWSKLVPTNSTAWSHLRRPVSVACWLFNYSDHIRLIFEVSAMDDPKLRLECVRRLKSAGFQLDKRAFEEGATYSRFWRCTQPVNDMSDAEETKEAVNKLLTKAKDQFPKVEAVLKEVFQGNTKRKKHS
ncbi:MAG: PD-(D/E)XK nuclease family protein [Phycisphaerae bacterium]